jgi:hypothetical protein
MPQFLKAISDRLSAKDILPINRYEGFTENGAIVLRNRRGTLKAEIPDVSEKGIQGGNDPLAIYKPTGTKQVDAAKAISPVYAAVNAIASEVANGAFTRSPAKIAPK